MSPIGNNLVISGLPTCVTCHSLCGLVGSDFALQPDGRGSINFSTGMSYLHNQVQNKNQVMLVISVFLCDVCDVYLKLQKVDKVTVHAFRCAKCLHSCFV